MQDQRLLDTFFDLVKTNSPSRMEAGVAVYCEAALRELGFTVIRDGSNIETGSETGNVIAWRKGELPGAYAFSAHMDCVMPCINVQPQREQTPEGEVIRSAGNTVLGSDDKAGVAAILEALRSLCEGEGPLPTLVALFTTCEEIGCKGAKNLDVSQLRAFLENEVDMAQDELLPCLVLDSDGAPGTIVTGSPYHYVFEARITGRAAHAGVNPEQGVSAIAVAADALSRIQWGRLGETTTANVGFIEGGQAVNVVPEQCTVKGECRSIYQDRAKALRDNISKAFIGSAHLLGAKLDMDWDCEYPGIVYQPGDELLNQVEEAAEAIGAPVSHMVSGGGSDANVLSTKGMKPVAVGVGMTNFHATNEYILVKDLQDSVRFVEAFVRIAAAKAQ